MAQLIQSANVYDNCNIDWQDSDLIVNPNGKNLGSLPTLYDQHGQFVCVVNSYFFDLKAVSRLKNLNSYARALLKYWSFLEESELVWDHFHPIKRFKPTYLFRSFLLREIQEHKLSQSTANIYINHIKNFYLWAIHEQFLSVKSEKEAPFKIEQILIQNKGMLAHLSPTIAVDSSDLRIRVAKDSQTQNVRAMTVLDQESLVLLSQHFCHLSVEVKLQCLLALQCGLRIQEVSTLSIQAINRAYQLTESQHRYEFPIGPSTGVETKFGKERTIEISIELLTALRGYAISERRLKRLNKLSQKLVQLNNEELTLSYEKQATLSRCERFEPLFISEQGNPVDKKVIGARWADLRKIIRQREPNFNYRFHDLRATYGTYRLGDLLKAGIQPAEALGLLMGWMGHNDESTTWKYLRYLKRKEVFKEKFALLDSIMHNLIGDDNE